VADRVVRPRARLRSSAQGSSDELKAQGWRDRIRRSTVAAERDLAAAREVLASLSPGEVQPTRTGSWVGRHWARRGTGAKVDANAGHSSRRTTMSTAGWWVMGRWWACTAPYALERLVFLITQLPLRCASCDCNCRREKWTALFS